MIAAVILCCMGEKMSFLCGEELVQFYLSAHEEEEETSVILQIAGSFLLHGQQQRETEAYSIQTESDFSYEAILAREAADENYIDMATGELVLKEQQGAGESVSDAQTENQTEETSNAISYGTGSGVLSEGRSVIYSREKLADFDYLIQNFYQVDNTTTITGTQLNADAFLGKDVRLSHDASEPQILIYHTHSQEGYADSIEGDTSMTVVGVGEELARILTEQYGMNVIHHTGEYDVGDRDHAYSKAGPALEQILAENPSIEVVIDLHRDGVREDTRLVTEMNGVSMAQIMFFNGLSRTTSLGDIDYLYNPYIADNLAISFQMQLKASEYYPGFTRKIYLKGYRYNMHYCPKTLLVEVGAQTNTLQEAKNAMQPLADILNKVLTGAVE
jgi:stage II sporulation protein P